MDNQTKLQKLERMRQLIDSCTEEEWKPIKDEFLKFEKKEKNKINMLFGID